MFHKKSTVERRDAKRRYPNDTFLMSNQSFKILAHCAVSFESFNILNTSLEASGDLKSKKKSYSEHV